MCFLHLLLETYLSLQSISEKGTLLAGVGVVLGILLQIGIEWFTGGIEHGHMHVHEHKKGSVPAGLVLGLCLHAFIEGLPLSSAAHHHNHHFLVSILVHKFPVALILVIVLKSLNVSTAKSWMFLILFTLMAPLGMLLSEYIISKAFIQQIELYMLLISGLVIGVLLHIGTTILFESSEGHSYNASKLAVIILGFCLALVTSM